MDFLLEMGYSDSEIAEAFDKTNGDFNDAASLLLSSPPSRTRWTVLENLSQYSFPDSGVSACTSIACIAVRRVLERLGSSESGDKIHSLHDASFLQEVLLQGIDLHKTVSISHGGSKEDSHTGVEDVLKSASDVMGGLRVVDSLQGTTLSEDSFDSLLMRINTSSSVNRSKFCGIVLTKPPETVALILCSAEEGKTSSSSSSSSPPPPHYVLFDSHSRPQLGISGAYLLSSADFSGVKTQLQKLFPPSSSNLIEMSLMEEMYASYEATVLQL